MASVSAVTRPASKEEARRFPRPDLRSVTSKVQSRSAPASPRTPANRTEGKTASANERKARAGKAEVREGGVKRQNSASAKVKVKAAVVKSIPKPRANRNGELLGLSERRRGGEGRTAEEATPILNGGGEEGSSGMGEGSAEEEGSGENAAEPRRSHVTKVSAKGRARAGPPAPGPPGPPGPPAAPAPGGGGGGGGPAGARLPQHGASSSGKEGQGAGAGSPPGGRQNQSQGIPRPRAATADRASGLVPPGSATSNPKPASSRPAAAAASKLPVKGLPMSLSSSSLGSVASETHGALPPSKVAAPVVSVAPGSEVSRAEEERPSRSSGAVSQSSRPLPFSSSPSSPSTCPSPSTSTCPAPAAAAKDPAIRSRAFSLQGRGTATGLRAPAVTSQAAAKNSQHALQRNGSTRLNRSAAATTVDRSKPRGVPVRTTASSSSSSSPTVAPPPQDRASGPKSSGAGVYGRRQQENRGSQAQQENQENRSHRAAEQENQENRSRAAEQLRRLLAQGNRRVEALATVVQHLFTEREEALKQKKELSLELANLRDELALSSQSCERLRGEKEAERSSLEAGLRRLGEEHREAQAALENRLRGFYQGEWDKVHQAYQQETDRYRALVEQQLEELRTRQEAHRQEQEVSHRTQMESLRQQHESSVQDLRSSQQENLDKLDRTLKETEASLSERLGELTQEKDTLRERLRVEEERRRILSDKTQKDAHTLYLERELESLKVVLEIKNTQLHQQDKKLMQMDKLMDSSVKLEECLKKVQQENEDYRARMDKHAALSRQLSSEQAALQQTLQKESKVNKRLSMENEELLWKLHNGDLASPARRLSPTSPFPLPRNSAPFPTAAPLAPR